MEIKLKTLEINNINSIYKKWKIKLKNTLKNKH